MNPRSRTTHAHALPVITRPIILMGFVAALLLVYYVVQANLLAATTWRLKAAQDRVASLKADRDDMTAQAAQLDDRTVLQALADRQGMVPAEHTAYIVQSDAVAAR